MTDKLMYIHNYDTQNYPFFKLQLLKRLRLDTELNKQLNRNSVTVQKVVKQKTKEMLL